MVSHTERNNASCQEVCISAADKSITASDWSIEIVIDGTYYVRHSPTSLNDANRRMCYRNISG